MSGASAKPGTEPPVEPDDEERHVSKAVDAPGIPMVGNTLIFWWMVPWFAAVLICLMSVPLARPFVYYREWIRIPDAPVTLKMDLAGCDLQIEPSTNIKGSWIRLSYWKSFGHGVIVKGDDTHHYEISVHMKRKMESFPCRVQVFTNPSNTRRFEYLNITMEKTDYANFNPGPSNVAEFEELHLTSFSVQKTFDLKVKTNANTILSGVQVDEGGLFSANVEGGKLEIHEAATIKHPPGVDPTWAQDKYAKEPYLPRTMNLTLKAATVVIMSRNNNLKAHIQNDTVDNAVLAGAKVTQIGETGSVVDFVIDKGSAGHSVDLSLEADNCAIYLSAYDKDYYHGDNVTHPLQVVTGETAKAISLLPDGEKEFKALANWLQNGTHNSKFVAYIQLTAPSVPAGTLRLLSTSSYMALSMSTFSIISGGMLTPDIIRIVTPITGFDWLFPRRPYQGELSAHHLREYAKQSFMTLHPLVDTKALGFPKAVWVWDPPGPEFDIFEYIPKKKIWHERAVGPSETFQFRLASAITVFLGLVVGIGACALLFLVVWPIITEKIRHQTMINAGSLQLQFQTAATDWMVPVAVVRYPLDGCLLRWNTRDLAAQFTRYTITARPWPVDPDAKTPIVDKIDPGRLPTMPQNPAQQLFLFAVDPPAKAPLKKPFFTKLFEEELYATGMRCCGTDGLPLKPGMRYQFRISAYGGAPKPIEQSAWSRPVRIMGKFTFSEMPLILWKTVGGILPSDSFAYFLAKHTIVALEGAPCLQIALSNMRLCVVNDSALFAGASGLYGQDEEVSKADRDWASPGVLTAQQYVQIQASTGSSYTEQTAADTMYEATSEILLPGANSSKRKSLQTLTQLVGKGKEMGSRTHGMESMKFLVLNLNTDQKTKQSLDLTVGLDLTQTVKIETVLIEELKGQDKQSASCESTWKEFITSLLRGVIDQKGGIKISDEIVMRDGLTPAAMLLADCELMNSGIGGNLKKKTCPSRYETYMYSLGKIREPLAPDVFHHVIPGMTFVWGESIPLNWSCKEDMKVTEPEFDVLLVSEDLPHVKHNKEKEGDRTYTLVVMDVQFSAEKVAVPMTPKQPYSVFIMRCHLEVRFHKDHKKVSSSSDEFVIVRPITQQDLELGYAAFCARNDIPMDRINGSQLTPFYGIQVIEKSFNICTGYRAPLPIVDTGEPEADLCKITPDEQGQPLVRNPPSYVIVDAHGLVVPVPGVEKKAKEEQKKKGAKDAETGSEAVPHKNLSCSSQSIEIPTNVYWKKGTNWEEEILLTYWLLPPFANYGWISETLRSYNMEHLAHLGSGLDGIIRGCLKTLLFLWQLCFLFFPGFFALWASMAFHGTATDVNPGLSATSSTGGLNSVALAQIIQPSAFNYRSLNFEDTIVYWFVILYFALIVVDSFYGNFIHHKHYLPFLYYPLNVATCGIVVGSFFLLVLYICVVLVWIVMGSMIDPGNVMPYALIFCGALFIAHTMWSKTSSYRAQIMKQMEDKLDLVTHAVMGIFVGADDSTAGPDFLSMVDALCELMRAGEAAVIDKLYDQAKAIVSDVDASQRDLILKLRESDEFKALGAAKDDDGKPGVQDQCMSTDFIPNDCWAKAQGKSNDDATIANKRLPADEFGTYPDEKISAEALAWSLAQQGLDGLGDPLKLNKEDSAQVQGLAKAIGLRPTTADICHQAFCLAVAQRNDPTLADASAMQLIFSQIRINQLFTHFICQEDPKRPGKMTSTALSYLKDLEKKDLLNLETAIANALTQLLYWPEVNRKVVKFTSTVIRDAITAAIDHQLNPVTKGTAAFKVRIRACDCLYKSFETTYKQNPVQFFVDVGIIEARFAEVPRCKTELEAAVSNFRNFDGSLEPSGLMQAVDWLCFPTTEQKEGKGANSKSFLWYEALVEMLTALGWNPDELEPTWLQSRWLELTENKGIFEYSHAAQVNALIHTGFADGGLWKGAVKAIMLHVNLGGYLACDLQRDGMEKAAKIAHNVYGGDQSDLLFLNSVLRWPQDMQDIWREVGKESKGGNPGPKGKPIFLELVKVDKFLQSVIYMPEIKDKLSIKRTQLSPNAVADLQWYKGDDGGLWDGDGGSARRLKGIWMELLLLVFDILECIPTDLDLKFKCLQWQYAQRGTGVKWLQLAGLKWLETDYLSGKEAKTATLTGNQFSLLLRDYMNCDIPKDVLLAQVFNKCPLVPDDDNGELRYLCDCAAALRYWMGYGLWKAAVGQVITYMMPRSPTRRLALQCLSAEFDKLDIDDIGVLQPGQAVALLRKLTHPGLTCPELGDMLQENLGLTIPERELHKYFTMNDVNGDGVLQVSEFVCTIRYLMTNYFPAHIMRNMNLSIPKIIGLVLGVVLMLVAAFICITLVVKTFTSGGVGHAVHSGVSGISVAAMKMKGDSQVGSDDSVSAVRAKIDTTLTLVVGTTLGLTPVAVDKLNKMTQEFKAS